MDHLEGIEDPEHDDDGLINKPLQIISEVSELEESDDAEVLFEPPPMFASSDEGEVKDELEEPFIMENGYEGDLPSPVIPSSLLEEQPRDDNRFHNLALEVWTEDDCLEWLEYIGLGHFTPEFREHHVDGKVLKNINFQLLEEIGINSPDEREVILSEIYRRFHPEEEDLFEMEIQGALQSASEQEKMKIMAVLNALRSPAFQAELGLTFSTGSSSPRDSDTGHHMASETASLSSSMTGSEGHSQDLGMPPPPPPPSWSQSAYSPDSLGRDIDGHDLKSKGGKSKKHGKTSKEKDKSGEKASKSEKQANKQKKHKRVSKLLDSLSLSSGSSKLTKLFHHSHSSSSSSSATKKLNPSMQYLLQAGPQGLLRIWPTALSEEMNYCSFMVNMTTTCAEIIKLVFVKYEVVDDPRRFYVCEMALGKGGSHHDLTDSDCPLLYQCRWADPDKQRFELRCRNEGVIKMLFELEGYEDDLDYRSIPLSSKTPCSEAVGIIVKKFDLPGNASEYYLVEVSEENEDDREEVADHVCPLRLQIAWSAPDHVFRLCRRPTEVKEEEHKDTLDGWTTDATEEISPEPGINSEVSSVRDEDELEFAPGAAGSIEGDEIVEEISDDLMEGLTKLDHVIDEESEAIASHELEAVRQELAAKEEELRELRVRSDTLTEREDEIEVLRRENEELRRRSEELGELTRNDESLVEKDRALEERRRENDKLRQRIDEIEEKFNNEISMRDREIERLYARNNELSSHEKELENLRRLRDNFESQGNELEKLRVLNEEYSSSESELALKLGELQEKHDELLTRVGEMEKLKEINRDLSHKAEESELLSQKLDRSEAEKNELVEKVNELERVENDSVRTGTVEVENLKKENLELAAKCKDAEEMKTNIIKLTAQMREMETQSQEQMDHFQEKLEDLVNEKQQLLDRIAELEEREKNAESQENSAKEVEDLKLENIFLVERTKEVDELKSAVAKLTADAKEYESFKQKYKELRDVESYLTKQVNAAETIARQKDKKLKESENKINTLTEAVKDMEAKLEEQEQNKLYLDQLLAMLKDRDPTLLHVINSSLAQSEPEEWC